MFKVDENTILINDIKVCLNYQIQQVVEFDNLVVVRYGDEDIVNNVVAIDKKGKEVWKINDLLKINDIGNFMEVEKISNKVLGAYYIWGIYFEIDIDLNRVIKKEYTR